METTLLTLRDQVLEAIRSDSTPLMLFGSVARGDSSPTSDIDVLELAERRRRPYKVGRVSVSVYDAKTLNRMAERGSLFVLHLRLEGQLLRDPADKLSASLNRYIAPPSYDSFRRALGELARLLDVDLNEYEDHWRAYNELALYIIRSEFYARFAEAGQPIFSLDVVKQRLDRADVNHALALKNAALPNRVVFARARSLISELLGVDIKNPYGSIEALVTNAGGRNSLLMAFGLRILGREQFELSYDLLTAPPFA
jgi:hypothetical protein